MVNLGKFFAENCAKKWKNFLFYATGKKENSPEWDLRVKKHREKDQDIGRQ